MQHYTRKPNDGFLFTLTNVQVKLHPIIVSKLDKCSYVRDKHFWTLPAMQWHAHKRLFAFLSGNLAPLFLRLHYVLNVFIFRSFVKSLSMPIDSLLTTIFFLETKSLPSIPTKRYESEPDLPKPKLLLPNAGRSNRHCLSIEKTSNRQKKGQVNNVLPSRKLIAPSLLTTENIARSKYSSRKKLLLHEKLPKPPKGASKLTSFRAILAVRRHAAVRAEGLLAPSSACFSVDKRCRLCMHGARALDRCSATHC